MELSERQNKVVVRATLLLAESDVWVLRAFEDGVPLSQARRDYRSALRVALSEAAVSEEPETIALPDRPAYA